MNIWGAFMQHSVNIQGTFGEFLGNIQGTFSEHSANNPLTSARRGLPSVFCWKDLTFSTNQRTGNIWGALMEHSVNIQGTFSEHSGNIQATIRSPLSGGGCPLCFAGRISLSPQTSALSPAEDATPVSRPPPINQSIH
jgi:hypothetical protein